ncbi:MAG: two pore domain potassium channel family protein [Proteobacteria bacterium]|nr:two pore domain potassium channel family protein [Pseudomonadota bacterium]
MLLMMGAAILLVGLTLVIHYEVLRLASDNLAEISLPPRAKIVVIVFTAFLAHTVEVWLYAVAYFIADMFDAGHLADRFGGRIDGFLDCVYFSSATYTSLGLGDVVPLHELRLLAGVEALNGLVLIGWSASFTYLDMEKFWPLHDKRRRTKAAPPPR